ncbi:2-C-methyl-D-erythritol 2,4-cyclodiphosphate synthase [Syntrophobotulus glycolicus DSM 8271]|uniref:2-C-methyl-D-erythritol 2,4-cyclodiphosphate synthase n=1 Tax=Syntrophobotulus glycolicus (strain DSM 8271 / FlGlyR) TaxID=645991 RepID=F0SXC2_SYNGF|nr:2-C-methyl-D-erythritol 2,4-cyclodiphosphate synthase [Syntrophobotulus glycolicus]ADY54668.1 2-C-methyl-D-erythritol 2,4-cyclodiphosphate synthase [Syntrophobotulus glycolicus DSM 8271]
MRIGIGYDVHALVEKRQLILGGVRIPYSQGLQGHSDADVLTHAAMDALLGACALGDIGKHFPDDDEKYRDISSMELLKEVMGLIGQKGLTIGNIDCIIIAQKPKLAPYIEDMRANLALAMKTDIANVSVKATTTEGLGFEGRGEGIGAQAVVLLLPVF